jgi:hypothetical protein
MVVCTCLAVWYHEEVKCMVAIMWSFTLVLVNKKFEVMLRFIQVWRFMLWSCRLWHHVARKVIPSIFKESTVCSFRIMVIVCFSNIFGNHPPDYFSILQNITVQKLNGANFLFRWYSCYSWLWWQRWVVCVKWLGLSLCQILTLQVLFARQF